MLASHLRVCSLIRFHFLLGSIPRFCSPRTFPPPDEDAAQYLSEALAVSSQDPKPRNATDVKNALEEARTRRGMRELGFEDRVSAALSILGVQDTEWTA